ncbi:MAG: hypothetical protein OXU45_03585 [Candidatus Melainabacteria bacterium]|nr:hypothetical protein [Candidatus Melainabacteria bacterium]
MITKSANIPILDHPYDSITYRAIDSSAKGLLEEQVQRMNELGFRLELAPEIEATTENANAEAFVDHLNAKNQTSYLPRFKALWQEAEQEIVCGIIELIFDKTNPIDFVNAIRDFKLYAKKIARDFGTSLSFFDHNDAAVFPSMHINFSLWEGDQNLFAEAPGKSKKQSAGLRRLACFVINRFMRDLAEAIFLFSSGSLSLDRLIHNGGFTKFFSWQTVSRDTKLIAVAKTRPNSLLIRDVDGEPQYARAEIRFSDASGLDSVKTLFIVRSITDSLDYLIRKYDEELEHRQAGETVSQVLERCIEAEAEDPEIVGAASTGDYYDHQREEDRMAYFFLDDKTSSPVSDKASMTVPRNTFSNSDRMREMLSDDLHAMVCPS